MKCILLIASALTIVLLGCTDVLIPDISNNTTEHILPDDLTILNSGDILFEWEPIVESDSTRFILVAPSFIDPVAILIDTFVLNGQLSLQLPSGDYEWKTEGVNQAFTSKPVISAFTVVTDQSLWIDLSTVERKVPLHMSRTNLDSILFEWTLIEGADNYQLQINPVTGTSLKIDTTATNLKVPLEEGTYNYQVIATNLITNTTTMAGEEYLFTIDRTGPEAPIFVSSDTIYIDSIGPHISWDGRDGLLFELNLIPNSVQDTLYIQRTETMAIDLPDMLVDTFSIDTIPFHATIHSWDDLGNGSDTTITDLIIIK